jgi:hypothetical protein
MTPRDEQNQRPFNSLEEASAKTAGAELELMWPQTPVRNDGTLVLMPPVHLVNEQYGG